MSSCSTSGCSAIRADRRLRLSAAAGRHSCPGYGPRVWLDHGEDHMMGDPGGAVSTLGIPRIPASAGALIFDRTGRLLILKPTYKAGWTIPGGQIEAVGESPWDACRREALEESGLEIDTARLACVDFLRPREDRPGGMRFLFDCGVLEPEQLRGVAVQVDEIAEYRFV